MTEKSRFRELSANEIQKILEMAYPRRQKKQQTLIWNYLVVRITEVFLQI